MIRGSGGVILIQKITHLSKTFFLSLTIGLDYVELQQGSRNSISTQWAWGRPLRMQVAFGNLKSYPPNLKGFQVKTTQKWCIFGPF